VPTSALTLTLLRTTNRSSRSPHLARSLTPEIHVPLNDIFITVIEDVHYSDVPNNYVVLWTVFHLMRNFNTLS
jgi:hypothetical protein